jgi:bifunctional non-homologous end joining protein LigD
MKSKEQEFLVNGRTVPVSNLEKVLYPEASFTKADVIDYYIRVSEYLMPHLRNRPLTMKRYPDGVDHPFFYEKRCPSHRPPWVKTASVWSERKSEEIKFCVLNDLATLVWVANLADLELHTSLARHPRVDRPDFLVFDLDPGPPADILDCCQVALWLRELLEEINQLRCFVKSTGSKGLQVYVPLNTAVTFDRTKSLAREIAENLSRVHPDRILARMEKRLRRGKVFIDWSQNDNHKTTVCVYSLRAMKTPTVSTPLRWKEVLQAHRKQDAELLVHDTKSVLQRVKKMGDLFEPVLNLKQKCPSHFKF